MKGLLDYGILHISDKGRDRHYQGNELLQEAEHLSLAALPNKLVARNNSSYTILD